MPALTGSRGAGRRGLHPEDDGRREDIQGAGSGAGPIPECGKELARGSMVTRRQTQHGVDKGGLVSEGNTGATREIITEPTGWRF